MKTAFIVFLGDNGGVLSFNSVEAVQRFAKEEQDSFAFLKTPKDFPLADVIEKQKAGPAEILQAIKSAKSEDHLRLMLQAVFRGYETGDVIAANSLPGKMMTAMEGETAFVLGVLFGASGQSFPKPEELFDKKDEVMQFIAGFGAGYPYQRNHQLKKLKTDIPDLTGRIDLLSERLGVAEESVMRTDETLSALRINIDYAKKKLNETVNEADELLSDVAGTAEAKIKEMIEVGEKRLDKQVETLKEAAKSRLKIKNAVDYWMDLAELYAMKTARLTWAFIGISMLGIVTVLGIALALVKAGAGENPMLILGVLGLPVFIFVTFLINLSRSRQLSEQKAAKAHERFVMVETLVALETEGKAAENERRALMKDLFKAEDKGQKK